jgi:hypothetical protein
VSTVTSSEILLAQPSEKRKFSVSFLNLLDDNEVINEIKSITSEIRGSDSISTLLITDTGVNSVLTTIDDVDYRSGTLVQFWCQSGVDLNTYRIECLVGTNAGEVLEGDVLLKIRDT